MTTGSRGGDASVRWQSRDTLELCLTGYATGEVVEPAAAKIAREIAQGRPRYLLFDTSAVTGYSPSVRGPGVDLLTHARAAGPALTVAVTPNGMVRMMGSSLAVVAGIRLSFVMTREEALRAIEAHRREHA